jgi:ribonucleoside-diphosphate reductase alpha chain
MELTMNHVTREPQAVTNDVLREKYCRGEETTEMDVFERVAKAVASVERTPELRTLWEGRFQRNMLAGAIGAGRIMAAAGSANNATYINCFVQPVGDCTVGYDEQQRPGIYTALAEAGETLRRGGGVGYNFSRIRPKGALVKGTDSEASGPCTFMDVFDTSCGTVKAAGSRRGAQMGILNIDHPDVREFIEAKRTKGRWTNFNVSVGVSDEFMQAVGNDVQWQLVHSARPSPGLVARGVFQRADGMWVYETVMARDLWDLIMKSAYDFAEPGIVFLTNMNSDNNLRYCEVIEATNPCAEEPLPPYGCCDLGPIILTRFVADGFKPTARFDQDRFTAAVKVQVRFLDNVLDATPWPLTKQKAEAHAKRRIGVGFTGMANALAMLNLRYDTAAGRAMAAQIAQAMCHAAYQASIELASERGAFSLFDAEKYLQEGTFASRLPKFLLDGIRKHGIRNSHLLAIAPTGTVSLAFADNASNGIEPPFALAYYRKKRMGDGSTKTYPVVDHGLRLYLETLNPEDGATLLADICAGKDVKGRLPASIVTALEMSCENHLAMLGIVQPYIDSAISKTVNVPVDYPFDDFKQLYARAHELGLKGCATYRPNDILGAVLETSAPAAQPEPASKDVDPLRVSIERRPEGELPSVCEKVTYWTQEGKKSLYLVVSFVDVEGLIAGKPVRVERPIEVFMPASQANETQQWVSATMRAWSLTAREGRLPKVLSDARKITWDKGPVRLGEFTKADGTAVPRWHDSEVAALAYAVQQILFRRGFLDEEGNPVPAAKLAINGVQGTLPGIELVPNEPAKAGVNRVMPGKKCSDCGGLAVIKKDGCDYCTNCGALGACG